MKSLFAATLVLVVSACGGTEQTPLTDAEGSTGASLTFTATQQQQMLDVVNYPATDAAALQSGGISATAAKSLITARNGADALAPSGDDFFFTTVAQLDAVPNVGTSALTHLQTYSAAHPAPAGETVKGVAFRGWQSQAAVWGVNQATDVQLDAMLDHRSVIALIKNRPFTTVAQLSTQPYMGAASIAKLLGAAGAWWTSMHGGSSSLAGRFDGAVFDEQQAEIALDICNHATLVQMTTHGMPSPPSSAIISNRPFSTLTQVAAVGGVGSATMNSLLAFAKSGQWSGGGGASCVSNFQAAVQPHLGDLLFLSESDRPIDIVAFPQAGTGPISGPSLMALLHSPAGWTAESRDPNNYYVDFEPNLSTSDMSAGATVQAAIAAQLTGVVYFAVHRPPTDIDNASVEVYLVGITSCGDVVGLHSVSIET